MMRVASCSVYVREDSPLHEHSFVRQSGEPWAWLDLGEHREASLYGSPAAMRRLAGAVIEAAVAAERLIGAEPEPEDVPAEVGVGS
jgi:hypothetical protein